MPGKKCGKNSPPKGKKDARGKETQRGSRMEQLLLEVAKVLKKEGDSQESA